MSQTLTKKYLRTRAVSDSMAAGTWVVMHTTVSLHTCTTLFAISAPSTPSMEDCACSGFLRTSTRIKYSPAERPWLAALVAATATCKHQPLLGPARATTSRPSSNTPWNLQCNGQYSALERTTHDTRTPLAFPLSLCLATHKECRVSAPRITTLQDSESSWCGAPGHEVHAKRSHAQQADQRNDRRPARTRHRVTRRQRLNRHLRPFRRRTRSTRLGTAHKRRLARDNIRERSQKQALAVGGGNKRREGGARGREALEDARGALDERLVARSPAGASRAGVRGQHAHHGVSVARDGRVGARRRCVERPACDRATSASKKQTNKQKNIGQMRAR